MFQQRGIKELFTFDDGKHSSTSELFSAADTLTKENTQKKLEPERVQEENKLKSDTFLEGIMGNCSLSSIQFL